MEDVELWRWVVGLEGHYQVSSLGRIRSVARKDTIGRRINEKVLNNARLTGRYARVRMRFRGETIDWCIHQMVLVAFVGERPKGMQACHGDGNVWNNRLSNLRWDTAVANSHDRDLHGRTARGESNGWSKLTSAQVREVKRMLSEGMGPTAIGRLYGVSDQAIRSIREGETWAHV